MGGDPIAYQYHRTFATAGTVDQGHLADGGVRDGVLVGQFHRLVRLVEVTDATAFICIALRGFICQIRLHRRV